MTTQTCVSTLALRHLVLANRPVKQLSDLRAPMAEILETLGQRLALLQKYEARYGPLDGAGDTSAATAAITISAPTPAPPLHTSLNSLQVTIPQPASGSPSASAGSGVNTPESSPY